MTRPMPMFEKIDYAALNARQQENYNFQKIAGRLAEYGYNCIRLNDDWQGADFLAVHVNGTDILRVQVKGRIAIDRKYIGKQIYIAFMLDQNAYVFPHDAFTEHAIARGSLDEESRIWADKGSRSWPSPPRWALDMLADYRI